MVTPLSRHPRLDTGAAHSPQVKQCLTEVSELALGEVQPYPGCDSCYNVFGVDFLVDDGGHVCVVASPFLVAACIMCHSSSDLVFFCSPLPTCVASYTACAPSKNSCCEIDSGCLTVSRYRAHKPTRVLRARGDYMNVALMANLLVGTQLCRTIARSTVTCWR